MSEMPPLIEARGLAVRFGKVCALDGLDVSAPTGEVLAILGPNGAGKTTFVRAVATLLAPSGGALFVRGLDVTEHPTAVRRELGLAGQSAAVEPTMTGRENLEMVARLFGHRRRHAQAAANDVIDLLGLGEVADRRSGGYSGGQRRRLDLGASLVGAPHLLLLDEPTTGLDPAGRAEVWAAVRNLVGAGTDVLLTTHYLEEADELAERVVVIDHGRAIATGTVAELKAGIGRDVIEVVLAAAEELRTAAALLEALTGDPVVTGEAVLIDHGTRRLRSRAEGGTVQLAEAIRAFATAGVAVEEISLRRPTLDEAFLALTGAGSAPERLPDPVSADSALSADSVSMGQRR